MTFLLRWLRPNPYERLYIPLERAYLCADEKCNAIGDSAQQCPRCLNAHVFSVQRVMDRK